MLGMICAVVMPFFNIPLMVRVIRRRSSADISLVWVIGVWLCIIGILPSSLQSKDPVFLAFGVINTFFFTLVFLVCLYFHPSLRKTSRPPE